MIEIKDVLGIGKILPVEKLIDVCSQGFGRVFKSSFDKKDIENRLYELKEQSKIKVEEFKEIANIIKEHGQTPSIEINGTDIKLIGKQSENNFASIDERIDQRLKFQENKRQLNIESIIQLTAEELANEKEVSDESLSENWINKFFRISEDISEQNIQLLFAKVLSGEIKRPNSYSTRTLELISNLSTEEAQVINRLAEFIAYDYHDHASIVNPRELRNEDKINVNDLLVLVELGILTSATENLTLNFENLQHPISFYIGTKVLVGFAEEGTTKQQFSAIPLSRVGTEIYTLIERPFNKFYSDSIVKSAPKLKFKIASCNGFEFNEDELQQYE